MSHHQADSQQRLLRKVLIIRQPSEETINLATSSAQIPSEFSNPNLEVLLSQEQIQTRIKEIGAEITREYAGLNPLLIGVLSILGTFLALHLTVQVTDVSIYSVNLATSLGLGLVGQLAHQSVELHEAVLARQRRIGVQVQPHLLAGNGRHFHLAAQHRDGAVETR